MVLRKICPLFLLLILLSSCGGIKTSPAPPTSERSTPTIMASTPFPRENLSQTQEPSLTLTPEPTLTLTPDVSPGYWGRYTPYQWNHDGFPYESEHFTVYGDGVDLQTKQRFALEAEKALEMIMTVLDISAEELKLPHGLSKIEFYASRFKFGHLGWGGYAYYGGFLMVYDNTTYRRKILQYPNQFPYTRLITHELTHTVGYLIEGYRSDSTMFTETWFDEGLAEYLATPVTPIDNQLMWEKVILEIADYPENGNPIAIKSFVNMPPNYPYAMFELAVRYLAVTYGHQAIKGIFSDIHNGQTFEESFAARMGMQVDQYQAGFFDLMSTLLEK